MVTPLVIIGFCCSISGVIPQIDVVYPRPQGDDAISRIDHVDYNFIFGSVMPSESRLSINGYRTYVRPNGSFIKYLPVDWNTRTYRLMAAHEDDTTEITVAFDTWLEPERPRKPEVSFPLLVTLSGGVARTHPNGAYYLFPDDSTQVLATDWVNGYWQVPIGSDRSVWVEDKWITTTEEGKRVETPIVWMAGLRPSQKWVDVVLPIDRKVLYRVSEEYDSKRIIIELYGVISHIDMISYPVGTELVSEVRWDQPSDGVLRLEIDLTDPSWGYRSSWEGGAFIFSIRRTPDLSDGISGLNIALDPGHGGDQEGAIGPTRLMEKDINLRIALAFARVLRREGANVIMTRDTDATLELERRIEIAHETGADLLISIHHNALKDGINPLGPFGTGVHYYHSQCRDLALAIQKEVVDVLELPNEGVYYHNLALVRPTAMPAVLLEAAYMILPEQEIMMLEKDYPDILANALCRGVKKFVRQRLSRTR